MKNMNQLERERKDRDYYNQLKESSFEDFQKYIKKIRRKDTIIAIIVIIIIYSLVISNFYFFGKSVSKDSTKERLQVRNDILINEATHRCEEKNQSFVMLTIINNKTGALVDCSTDNLIIGGKEKLPSEM